MHISEIMCVTVYCSVSKNERYENLWKAHCHCRDLVVGTFIFKVDSASIAHKRVFGTAVRWLDVLFVWKSHCKLPAALTQMHSPVGFHPMTAAFHLTPPSMNLHQVFQHYGPLENPKVSLSLRWDKLSNDWYTFPFPANGTECTQWSPCQDCGASASYCRFIKVMTI